jgi:2-iminobutanoate/2-iminopropanoate deaminase
MARLHNPSSIPRPEGRYSHGLELPGPGRLLFISGQIPESLAGGVPDDFASQCRVVWGHIGAVLNEAGMNYSHLLKVTTFLSDRSYAEANGEIRREVLGMHCPALTVVVVNTLDPRWLLEVEAIAGATTGVAQA